ncbi:hypothetical protein E5288_WYG018534 [Bos mutus]|uniref:Lipocalin/cytosolic fatty-acid binding domain-containing protein n=1 Tax=Bos mutus TaxID=72004 RepID=A0A6B0RZE6_9CETA|nr:hypothetical protein [Bos mutus]
MRVNKMKILLLSLVLSLLLAGQSEAQEILSQFSGEWRTHYIAASNKEKVTENGPFHMYYRHVEFDEDGDTLEAYFYLKGLTPSCGICKRRFPLSSEDAGQNEVQILHVSENSRDDRLSDTDFERFKEETRWREIPEENIVNFIDNDDCPEE